MINKKFGSKDNKFKFITPTPTVDTCPYCGFKFEKSPTRKKMCPNCKNIIYVRFSKLYTEEEKNIRDWLDNFYIKEIGITRDEFNKKREQLSRDFGFAASVNDTIWRLLSSINTPDKKPQKRRLIFLAMEQILLSEGKDANHIRSEIKKIDYKASFEANKSELLSLKAAGFSKVEIVTCNDEYVCPTCKALSHKVLDINEALREMPIPQLCENDQCRCSYNAHFD